jgi:tetratricopeptide (TPR) repeat protein
VVNPATVNGNSVPPPNVVNPATVNDKSVQTSSPHEINSTMIAKVESPTVAAEAQSTTIAALAVPKPSANQNQVKQTSSPGTEISSPVLAATNKPSYTGKERKAEKVEQLLAQAENQFNKERFTSPVGDNAYETYQQLLAIAPLQAQIVLDKIIAWYYHQGKKYLDQGKITKPSVGNAYQSYQRMQEITPSHPNTQALLDDIINSLTQQLERELGKISSASTKGNSAYTIYQELVTVAPNHEKVPSLQSKIIDRLMQRAKQQEAERKYSEPNGDNAVDTYKEILKLVPNHQAATMELEELVQQQYYQRAVRYSSKEDYETCMKLINKGLKILPNDRDLNKLKQEVEEKMLR